MEESPDYEQVAQSHAPLSQQRAPQVAVPLNAEDNEALPAIRPRQGHEHREQPGHAGAASPREAFGAAADSQHVEVEM